MSGIYDQSDGRLALTLQQENPSNGNVKIVERGASRVWRAVFETCVSICATLMMRSMVTLRDQSCAAGPALEPLCTTPADPPDVATERLAGDVSRCRRTQFDTPVARKAVAHLLQIERNVPLLRPKWTGTAHDGGLSPPSCISASKFPRQRTLDELTPRLPLS